MDVDEQIKEAQVKRGVVVCELSVSSESLAHRQAARQAGVGLSSAGGVEFDQEIYGGSKKTNYASSLPTEDEEREIEERGATAASGGSHPATKNAITAPQSLLDMGDDGSDPFKDYREAGGSGLVNTRISDREGEVSMYSDLPSLLI
jgi:hypothetical protein